MQICYNVNMRIFTYLKEKLSKRAERRTYEKNKRILDLSFPLYCKAHGVKTADRQGAIAQSHSGDKLQIAHSPVAGYPYNVYIYNVELNRILGYLQEQLSKKLVELFGEGFCRDAQITEITGGGEYKYRGCNLVLFESMRFMQDLQADLPYLHS